MSNNNLFLCFILCENVIVFFDVIVFLVILIPLSQSRYSLPSWVDVSSQNILNTESSVHFIGGFLVSWETTRTCFAFLHESIKEGFLLPYRSFNFKFSDSCEILRGETSSIDDRCKLFTILFLFLLRLCHRKMINLPNVQTKTTSALKMLFAHYQPQPSLGKSLELLKSWCHWEERPDGQWCFILLFDINKVDEKTQQNQ